MTALRESENALSEGRQLLAKVEMLTDQQRSLIADMRRRGEDTAGASEVLATLESWLAACRRGVTQLEQLLRQSA